jgi:hypothetical protein
MINGSFLKKHKTKLTTFAILHLKLLTILLILLSTYSGIYGTRAIFPDEAYLSKISKMFDSGLVGAEVTSRSPTGWLSDNATECLSLGVGLEKKTKFGDQYLDTYANPLTGYNPCSGLIFLAKGENQNIESGNYSRYWHGHATITQWFTFFLGIPILKNLIWILNFLLIYLIFRESKLISSAKKTLIPASVLLLTYLALSDYADIHTSITHLLVNTFLFLTVLFFLITSKDNYTRVLQVSFVLGSLYCFVLYGLSPQNIPIAILSWGLVILLTSHRDSLYLLKKSVLFLYGWGVGYLATFVSKWFLVSLFTDFDIFSDVQAQISHRTSQDSSSLSNGVMQHLEFASSLPAFLQAWIANFATLLIHVIDPRYAEKTIVIFVSIFLIGIVLFNVFIMVRVFNSGGSRLRILIATNAISFCLLLSWYTILAQHSFDHATYTFRSLVIWLGGFLGTGIFILHDKPVLIKLGISKSKNSVIRYFQRREQNEYSGKK